MCCIPLEWHLTESTWNCAIAAQGTRSTVSSRRARHCHLEAQPLVLLTATTACRTVPSQALLLAARCLQPASWQLSAQVGAGKAMYCPCSRDCISRSLQKRVLRFYCSESGTCCWRHACLPAQTVGLYVTRHANFAQEGGEWLAQDQENETPFLWFYAAMLLTRRAKRRRVAHSGEWHACYEVHIMLAACAVRTAGQVLCSNAHGWGSTCRLRGSNGRTGPPAAGVGHSDRGPGHQQACGRQPLASGLWRLWAGKNLTIPAAEYTFC